jgi:hypothetical protein
MERNFKLLPVPATKPAAAGELRFNRDWAEGEGLAIPNRIIGLSDEAKEKRRKNNNGLSPDDFLIDFNLANVMGNWTMPASLYQGYCEDGKVNPYVTKDGREVVNPHLFFTFRREGKRIGLKIKTVSEADAAKMLK